MAAFVIGADHVRGPAEVPLTAMAAATGILKAAFLWTAYIALEPITRRRWPHALISWARLLEGRWKDPLVGRDVMLGMLAAVLTCIPLLSFIAYDRTLQPTSAALSSAMVLGGVRTLFAGALNSVGQAILSCLATFLVLFMLRLLLRRDWIVVIAAGLLFGIPSAVGAGNPVAGYAMGVLVNVLAFFVAVRFGITSLYAFLAGVGLLYSVAGNMDFSVWYASNGVLLYSLIAAVATGAFRSALAGRPLSGDSGGNLAPPPATTVVR